MYHDITAEDILQQINFQKAKAEPGMVYDISARTSNRSREQLNNPIIEEHNNTSRKDCEDVIVGKCPLSQPPKVAFVHEDFGSVITPSRELTYRGISVQHCRPKETTKFGIKLAITLQTAAQAQAGKRVLVTAELKRYQRLREIKSRLDDTAAFAVYLEATKQDIHAIKNHQVCMGRIHARGQRTAWIRDALVVGIIRNNVVQSVVLNLEGEEYQIELDTALSPKQEPLYLASGTWGEIVNPTMVSPRLSDLIAVKFGERA
jgi:hypothetical protein